MSTNLSTEDVSRCCECRDDEAYKYGECFCRCHTRSYQSEVECYHCGPREVASGKCKCTREVYSRG